MFKIVLIRERDWEVLNNKVQKLLEDGQMLC